MRPRVKKRVELLDAPVRQAAADLQAFLDDPEPIDRPELWERIERDMELVRGRERPRQSKRWFRRVAAAAVLATVIGGGSLVAVGALEIPFWGWFQDQFDAYNRTNTNIDLHGLREHGFAFAPSWLPDGWVVDGFTQKDELLTHSFISFYHEEDERFGYLEHYDEFFTHSYDVEHGGRQQRVGDYEGYISSHQGTTILIWRIEADTFILGMPEEVDIVRVAESVQKIS